MISGFIDPPGRVFVLRSYRFDLGASLRQHEPGPGLAMWAMTLRSVLIRSEASPPGSQLSGGPRTHLGCVGSTLKAWKRAHYRYGDPAFLVRRSWLLRVPMWSHARRQ